VIQRLLRTNDISWGTYVDPLGTHCNAHPNNFVLLPEVHSQNAQNAECIVCPEHVVIYNRASLRITSWLRWTSTWPLLAGRSTGKHKHSLWMAASVTHSRSTQG
jgi:hypothetical protein